jgi:hypothetical protein
MWRIDPLLGKDLKTNNETRAVAMQRRGKHASTTRVTTGNGVFYSIRAGSNTSTVALRVVESDEKGTQCLRA